MLSAFPFPDSCCLLVAGLWVADRWVALVSGSRVTGSRDFGSRMARGWVSGSREGGRAHGCGAAAYPLGRGVSRVTASTVY